MNAALPLALLSLALATACNRTPSTPTESAPAQPSAGRPTLPEAPRYKAMKEEAARAAGDLLAVGATPTLKGAAQDGTAFDLAAAKGKVVVVYFYPKDDTPGCTVEAQGFRDSWPDLQKAGALVVGVSGDDAASHQAFAAKHSLPFLLLPDVDGAIAKTFGVPRLGGFARRVTFVLDREGKVARVFPEVKPQGHAAEILEAVRAL